MNKKYDEDFFEDLDKTTDLLKAFKPHVESKTDNLEDLFNEYISTQYQSQEIQKSEVDELTRSIKPIRTMKEAYELEAQIKEQQRLKREQEELERQQELERQKQQLIEKKQAELQEVLQSKEQARSQQKTDINEILGKMSETVEQQKQEKLKKEQERKIKVEKKKKKKDGVKFTKFELAFCALSFLFIIGCIWAFSNEPKGSDSKTAVVSLSTAITRTTPVYAGDGLYSSNGVYTYKGSNVNNYLYYSNMTWRIIKINKDDTIDLVLDNSINSLKWDISSKSYIESDIHKYLNNYFINYLDDTYLEKVDICLDEVDSSKNFKCENIDRESYVRLLTLDEYNESKANDSYISNTNSSIWLSTKYNDKVWSIRGLGASLNDPNLLLEVRPVIKIKGNLELLSGTGSKDNPYKITRDNSGVNIGNYVKLDNDIYVVFDNNNNMLKLASTKLIPNVAFDTDTNRFNIARNTNIAFYLNNTYLNTLTYKDLLLVSDWYNGVYVNSYEEIFSSSIKAKVGIYDISSLKFDNDLVDYYLANPVNNDVLVYNKESYGVRNNVVKGIRPTICIATRGIVSGTGSKDDPFILER